MQHTQAPTLEAVLAQYGASLARVARTYEASAAGREDLLQDVALALLKALPRYRGDSALGTFVYRVATNVAIDRLARRPPDALDLAAIEDRPDPGPTPESLHADEHRRERLARALRRLPLTQRQVMSLVLEGLSHGQIAAVLGLTENNVAVRANRARTQLRQWLEE